MKIVFKDRNGRNGNAIDTWNNAKCVPCKDDLVYLAFHYWKVSEVAWVHKNLVHVNVGD